jgi:hypothetical protein
MTHYFPVILNLIQDLKIDAEIPAHRQVGIQHDSFFFLGGIRDFNVRLHRVCRGP